MCRAHSDLGDDPADDDTGPVSTWLTRAPAIVIRCSVSVATLITSPKMAKHLERLFGSYKQP